MIDCDVCFHDLLAKNAGRRLCLELFIRHFLNGMNIDIVDSATHVEYAKGCFK